MEFEMSLYLARYGSRPADVLQLIWDTVRLDVRARLKAWAWKELHIELKARIVETMFRKYQYTAQL